MEKRFHLPIDGGDGSILESSVIVPSYTEAVVNENLKRDKIKNLCEKFKKIRANTDKYQAGVFIQNELNKILVSNSFGDVINELSGPQRDTVLDNLFAGWEDPMDFDKTTGAKNVEIRGRFFGALTTARYIRERFREVGLDLSKIKSKEDYDNVNNRASFIWGVSNQMDLMFKTDVVFYGRINKDGVPVPFLDFCQTKSNKHLPVNMSVVLEMKEEDFIDEQSTINALSGTSFFTSLSSVQRKEFLSSLKEVSMGVIPRIREYLKMVDIKKGDYKQESWVNSGGVFDVLEKREDQRELLFGAIQSVLSMFAEIDDLTKKPLNHKDITERVIEMLNNDYKTLKDANISANDIICFCYNTDAVKSLLETGLPDTPESQSLVADVLNTINNARITSSISDFDLVKGFVMARDQSSIHRSIYSVEDFNIIFIVNSIKVKIPLDKF